MTKKIDNILLSTLRWGVYFSLFIPLFASKRFYYPYISVKVFLFRTIIEILFVVWITALLRGIIKLPKLNYLMWAVLAYVLILFSSVFTGVAWYRSWWGTIERGSGMFTFLHYLMFFFILITVFKSKQDWNKLIDIFLWSSLLVGLYALAQKLNLPFVHESGIARVTGSTGNAAHLASFLIFSLFISMGNFFRGSLKEINKQKIFYATCFAVSFLGIGYSQTRGAMIGIAVGLLAFFFLLSWLHQNKKVRLFGISIFILLIIAGGFIFLNKDKNFVKENSFLKRFTSINLQETTIKQRFFSWGKGLQAWQEKPILGWGTENYNIAFNKYFDASYYDITPKGTYFDKAHNIVMELLVTNGVLGFASYLVLGFFIYYYLFKYYKKNKDEIFFIVALISLFTAYFTQNLLVFDTVITYLVLFFLLAYIYIMSQNFKEDNENILAKLTLNKKAIIFACIILSTYLILWQNVRPAMSAYYTRKALNENNKEISYYQDFSNLMRKSLSYHTVWDTEYIAHYTSTFKNFRKDENVDKQAVGEDVVYIVEAGEKYLVNTINDARFVSQMSGLYEIIYDYLGDAKALERAEELTKITLNLSPERVYYYHILAQLYEFNGRDQLAIEALEKARELNPNIGDTYWGLAVMYSKLDQGEKTIKNVKKAIKGKATLNRIIDIEDVLPIFEQEKDYQSLIFLYQQAINLQPDNIDYLARLAGSYASLGRDEEAIKTAEKIININPLMSEQVNQFVADVKAGKYLEVSIKEKDSAS